jgi:hypothetical protein
MKPLPHLPVGNLLAVAFLCFGMALPLSASPSPAKESPAGPPAALSPVPTNTAPAQPEIPKSVFLIPTSPLEGKDPFFPRSVRLFASSGAQTNLQPTAHYLELRLNGISGPLSRRLAIINNQTFAVNEEGEVPTNSGRARIRCLQIKDDSVVVQVGGKLRTLQLRHGL